MHDTDLLRRHDATGLAELVRSGDVSPIELLELTLAAIESLNPRINAVIGTRAERARAEAVTSLDDHAGAPFGGVPMLVKDLGITMAGEPFHAGTRVLREIGNVSTVESYLAAKFRSAGFVVAGRTNTPELGSTVTTEPLSYGPSRNPWDPERSTGGSSGGSAAAVAAGLVPVAHGGDGGGSIRIPAGNCGVFGLKTSRARTSQGPAIGEDWAGFTVDGVITRSVRDTARVLDAIEGPMPGDPYAAPRPVRPFADEVGRDPGRLRIGVLDHPAGDPDARDPQCADAVADAAALLAGLGHDVVPAWPAALEETSWNRSYREVVASSTAFTLAKLEAELGRALGEDDLEADNLALAAWGASIGAAGYLAAIEALHAWSRRVVEWWQPVDGSPGFDILLTPTLGTPPPLLGALSGPERAQHLRRILRFTAQFNVTGQPAMSVPLHWTDSGLPIGVQFVGAPWQDGTLLALAGQLERARPWFDRRPPISV